MKKFSINLVFLLISAFCFAQTNSPQTPAPAVLKPEKKKVEPIYSIFQKSDEAKLVKEKEMGKTERQCAPELPKVKSDDVIFAKRVSRDIYFADPTNRYLVPAFMDRNLIDILLKGVESFDITAYQGYNSSLNKLEEPLPDTEGALKTLIDTKVGQFTPRQYGEMDVLSKMGLRIVEDWYFDTNRSEFKPFIISIGVIYAGNKILVAQNADEKNLANPSIKLGEAGDEMNALFYVNYPTIRNYLCKFTVYHPNEKIRYTFDDVFQLRYFSSLIIEESNPDGLKLASRPDLKSGLDKLLEADRIKRSLIQYEQDMWQQ